MTLSSQALISLAALKRYLQLSSEEHDDLLESLIEAVSSKFSSFTGRSLMLASYSPDPESSAFDAANTVFDGNGHSSLLLPQYPVQSVTRLEVSGLALSPAGAAGSSGWVLDAATGVLALKRGVFAKGLQNVEVSYTAGFTSAPEDLAQAALEQTAMSFQQSTAGHGRLGIKARTLADGSVSYSEGEMLPQVQKVLERYRARTAL